MGAQARSSRTALPRLLTWAVGLLVFPLALPTGASADLVVFTTGRTMSVKSSRVADDRLLVALKGGGEASFPLTVVARVAADEAPPTESVRAQELPGTSDAALADTSAAVPANRPFADMIAAAATAHGVDVRLVHAVIEAESDYRPRARSRKGAKGLMQLMPDTARQYAVRDPYDPKANIDAGVRHLKALLSQFELGLALAAYNSGEATVRRYGGVPPFAETRRYVSRILQRVGR